MLLVSGMADAIAAIRVRANAGNADAQSVLGYAYHDGQGVPQDDAQAVAWYRKAADQGVASAQFNLGIMYAHGHGVPQDYVVARFAENYNHRRDHESLDRVTPADV